MSMTQIYDTAAIKAKAGEITTQNSELRKIIIEMEGIVSDLSAVWQDSAQTKFVQQFNEMKPELESFCKNIDKFVVRAEKHVADIEKISPIL